MIFTAELYHGSNVNIARSTAEYVETRIDNRTPIKIRSNGNNIKGVYQSVDTRYIEGTNNIIVSATVEMKLK